MNHFTVTIKLDTLSDYPEEWIADLVVDALELDLGEQLRSISCSTDSVIAIPASGKPAKD
ncbi:hypothetical protein STIP28_11 [Synechococcus T7-like virus S-TIP28]|uniref:Uncharacterized protein n=1 Tax=Synechococcus T7-like virus S-TIP28 TaxID=1332140 RepID=A0AAE8XEZ0_9CAUD|nr:hypothetical protein STIP28_11 [Synechococcus T7-like virus S-TIP28]